VLETAAGTGIVTRKLRDALAKDARLTATDLNPPMLEVARAKFRAGEQVEFQPADATALPFADGSFDAVMCQFGIMFFRTRPNPVPRFFAYSFLAAAMSSASGIPIATIRFGRITHASVACRCRRSCFRPRSHSRLSHQRLNRLNVAVRRPVWVSP